MIFLNVYATRARQCVTIFRWFWKPWGVHGLRLVVRRASKWTGQNSRMYQARSSCLPLSVLLFACSNESARPMVRYSNIDRVMKEREYMVIAPY